MNSVCFGISVACELVRVCLSSLHTNNNAFTVYFVFSTVQMYIHDLRQFLQKRARNEYVGLLSS
jgi:hypothetical protein